jgi:hypothetical protein
MAKQKSMCHLLNSDVTCAYVQVITSCSRTKDELVQEVENFNQRKLGATVPEGGLASDAVVFKYLDHVRAYPNADSIATVAFLHT